MRGRSLGGVHEGLELGHVCAHIVSPFQDLRADVIHEGLKLSAAEYHDPVAGVVHEEKAHCCARA
jgi:hypothetical protein